MSIANKIRYVCTCITDFLFPIFNFNETIFAAQNQHVLTQINNQHWQAGHICIIPTEVSLCLYDIYKENVVVSDLNHH